MAMMDNPDWKAGYDAGYRDGESNMQADFYHTLSEIVPADVDATAPSQVGNYILDLQREIRLRERQ